MSAGMAMRLNCMKRLHHLCQTVIEWPLKHRLTTLMHSNLSKLLHKKVTALGGARHKRYCIALVSMPEQDVVQSAFSVKRIKQD